MSAAKKYPISFPCHLGLKDDLALRKEAERQNISKSALIRSLIKKELYSDENLNDYDSAA